MKLAAILTVLKILLAAGFTVAAAGALGRWFLNATGASRVLTTAERRIFAFGLGAAWLSSLEYDLWEAVLGGPRKYGRMMLHDGLLLRLKDLSHKCGGWIRFDDERGEVFVILPQWQKMFASRTLR